MSSLWLSSLTLTNFRNYQQLKFSLGAAPIVLVGRNGAGKTNLLEAVSFLAPGRGLRRAAMSDVQRQGSDAAWAVAACLHTPHGEVDIGTGLENPPPLAGEGGVGVPGHPPLTPPAGGRGNERRIIRIDGKNKNQNELAKYVSALWLTPQMDALFLESDSARRRFLDRLVTAFDPQHAAHVADYETAMRERNAVLLQPSFDSAWASALEQKMAELGVAVAIRRRQAADHLNEAIRISGFSFPKARITLEGPVESELEKGASALAIEEWARRRLQDARPADAASNRCTFGLHRATMRTWFDAKNRQAEHCSTGEQKALLLSIILGQAVAVKAWRGTAPLLLLDEVVSHLDEARRAELCEAVLGLGSQAWLSGTDEGFFAGLGKGAQRFHIEAGKATKIG